MVAVFLYAIFITYYEVFNSLNSFNAFFSLVKKLNNNYGLSIKKHLYKNG